MSEHPLEVLREARRDIEFSQRGRVAIEHALAEYDAALRAATSRGFESVDRPSLHRATA